MFSDVNTHPGIKELHQRRGGGSVSISVSRVNVKSHRIFGFSWNFFRDRFNRICKENVASQFDVSLSISRRFSANNRKEPSGASAGGNVDAVSPHNKRNLIYSSFRPRWGVKGGIKSGVCRRGDSSMSAPA